MAGGERINSIEKRETFQCLTDYLRTQTIEEVHGKLNQKAMEINMEMRKTVEQMTNEDKNLRCNLLELGIINGVDDLTLSLKMVECEDNNQLDISRTIGYFWRKRIMNEKKKEERKWL